MNSVPRRGLIDGLGGIFRGESKTSLTPTPTPTPSDPGLTGKISSDLGGIGSAINSPFSSDTSSSSSSSSTVSTLSGASGPSSSLPSSSLAPSSSSSLPSSSPPPSSPPAFSTSSSFSLPLVTSSPSLVTSTSYTQIPPSSSSSPSPAAANSPKSFLENKPLSGAVFGLVGLVALIGVLVLITTCVRRRSRNRLHDNAANISFDPTDIEDIAAGEKQYSASRSGSHSGQGPAYISDQASSTGHGVSLVPDATYSRQDYGAASAAYLPNPYVTYGNQLPRSTSPIYGAAAVYNGYPVNKTRSYGYAGAPAPLAKDFYQSRVPAASPLPERFGDDDVYGGVTSIDVMEDQVGNRQVRNLHVANE